MKRKSRTDKKAYIKKDTQESRQIYMHVDKIQTKAEESEAGRQRMTERE